MGISVGERLVEATLLLVRPEGQEAVTTTAFTAGRRVVIFAVSGAFTPTCDAAHLPSFLRNLGALRAQGIDAVACLAVNDVHVMRAWGRASGAFDAGITMLVDPEGAFTAAIGMQFSVPAVGMIGRSRRYAMMIEDGVVRIWNPEPDRGCAVSGGEAMLAALGGAAGGAAG
jgi:cytochrome c peroxidase